MLVDDLADLRPFLLRLASRAGFYCHPEELVQETLEYLWQESAHFDPAQTSLRAWAVPRLRVMRNTLIDLYRLNHPKREPR